MLVRDLIDTEVTDHEYIICCALCKLIPELSCPGACTKDFVFIQIYVLLFRQMNSQFFRLSTWQFYSVHKYQKFHFHVLEKSQSSGINISFLYESDAKHIWVHRVGWVGLGVEAEFDE